VNLTGQADFHRFSQIFFSENKEQNILSKDFKSSFADQSKYKESIDKV